MDLSIIGKALAADLHTAAKKFDPRSDDCDILEYEAAAVEMRLNEMEGIPAGDSRLRESTLLSTWGLHTRPKVPDLVDRVTQFYHAFETR